jgi:hypothetical protein
MFAFHLFCDCVFDMRRDYTSITYMNVKQKYILSLVGDDFTPPPSPHQKTKEKNRNRLQIFAC